MARCTVYDVAPATTVHDKLIWVADAAVATTPVGAAGPVVAETWAETAEDPDAFTAATT